MKGVLVDRRMFLTATGAGLMPQVGLAALGPALVQQGNRGLEDITADELMELLAWGEINPEDVMTIEEVEQERNRTVDSLHPHYCFEYREEEPDSGRKDRVWFSYWWCNCTDEYSEWEEADGCIEIGGIWTHEGYAVASPIELVKWFLDHGFKVW